MKSFAVFVTYRAVLHADDRVALADVEARANRTFGDYSDGRYPFDVELAHAGVSGALASIAARVTSDLAYAIVERYRTKGQLVQRYGYQIEKHLPETRVDRIESEPRVSVVAGDAEPAGLEALCTHLRARVEALEYELESLRRDQDLGR